mgnify:CR=1 FL=1
MKPVCEIIVRTVLPGLRAMLVDELMKTYGLNQVEVSEKLGVTQPSVSQYRKKLRGKNVKILQNKKIKEKIKDLAENVNRGMDNKEIVSEICKICNLIKEENLLCGLHRDEYTGLDNCFICPKCD